MIGDDAIKPALLALVRAYRKCVAPAADATADEVIAPSVLQQIQSPDGAADLAASLDDNPGEVAIAPSVLIALIQSAIHAQDLERRLADSEREADEAWGAIDDARRIMTSGANVSTRERQSEALRRLKLLRAAHNKGTMNPAYQEAARLYYRLRCGGHTPQKDGPPIPYAALSHDDAVREVEKFARIGWDELARAWRRYGIEVRTEAEVFPISTVKVQRRRVKKSSSTAWQPLSTAWAAPYIKRRVK